MAGIDYTIPGQFKGLQIEPPMNAMARAMELRNLQETSQLNALKAQEYQQQVKEKNALAQLMANEKLPYGSDAFYSQLATVAPSFYEKIATGEAQRQTALSTKQQREAAVDKSKFDLDEAKKKGERDAVDFRLKQFNEQFPAYSIRSEQDVEDRIVAMSNDEILGPLSTRFGPLGDTIARNKAEFRRDPRNYVARLSGVSADKILEAADSREKQLRESAEKSYPAYQLSEYEAGREPLPIDQYVAQRMQTTAAPTTTAPAAATPGPEFLGAEGAEGVVTKSPDGSVNLPPVTKSAGKMPSAFGADIHPLVPSLIAGGNVEAAKLVQDGYKTTGALRQINDAFKELERLETEKPKGWEARSKALRDYIKVVSTEGPGTKFNLGGITLSTEKKYGEKFAGNVADKDVDLKDAAERAPETAATANRILGLLQSGQVITGSAANIKLQMSKFLRLGGGSESEAITNTEVLLSSLADSTLGAIKSSGLGSGQGFTDKDREFLERAKAGQITYEAASLKRLAELAHKASTATASKWNKRSKAIPKSAIEGTGISTEDIEVPPIFGAKPADKTKPAPAAPAPYSDAEKERRYQEYKASQKGQ